MMARLGLSFKMESSTWGYDLVYDDDSRNLETVEGDDSIPQTVQHFLLTQLGELDLHPDFGIDIYGIMTSQFPHTLMLNEIRNLKDKLNFETYDYTLSIDGREVTINASLEEV